jgi:hypothetical protein
MRNDTYTSVNYKPVLLQARSCEIDEVRELFAFIPLGESNLFEVNFVVVIVVS